MKKTAKNIPTSTKVWHYTNIYPSAKIGENCNIGSYVEIGENVVIGDGCRIEAFAFIPEGVTLEDNVFVGPHVCFTNDKYPPSGGEHWKPTRVKQFAAIGANATILPGITIGVSAVVAAGSVVVEDVEDHAIVMNCAAVTIRDDSGTDKTVLGSVIARRKGSKK